MLRVIGWLILLGAAVQYWRWILGIVVVIVVAELIARCYDTYQADIAAEREAEAARQARLIANADREHRLVQQGSLDGIYGRYSPPPEMRGTGIWLAG